MKLHKKLFKYFPNSLARFLGAMQPTTVCYVLLISSFLHAQVNYIDYPSPYHDVVGKGGMVVSQNKESSELGLAILNAGGNAIDAAVGVGFSLAITLPRAGNLGGGGFMLAYMDGEVTAIDYRGAASLSIDSNNFLKLKTDSEHRKYGYSASTTPGSVHGLLTAHQKWGKLKLTTIMQYVIDQAKSGIKVSYDLHQAIKSAPQLTLDSESRKIYFLANGDALPEGYLMKRPDLAKTFSLIARDGLDGFYKGKIADAFASSMQKNDGYLTLEDMSAYQSKVTNPLSTLYRNHTVYGHPAPSGGSFVVLGALNTLENFELQDIDPISSQYIHLFSEALMRGHIDRSRYVGDPDFYNVPSQLLLSKERGKEHANSITLDKKTNPETLEPNWLGSEGENTTHFSIIDKDGNAVSNTYTLGYSFGSGVTIPGTGILMNNQMNNFAYQVGNPDLISRSVSPGNAFEAGKRPMSTMAPTMVFDENDRLSLITGSPGGSLIPAAVLRIILGVIDNNLSIGNASMLPRIHRDWPTDTLRLEKGFSTDTKLNLETLGYKLEENKTMGSTQSILIHDGMNYGYADLRRPNAGVAKQD
jgi:gamma-glutamyltranspeptidase/glutathione hydrolase